MSSNEQLQQESERHVVEAFLNTAGLSFNPESIQSLDPPQPDTICTLTDGTKLAFELTEVVDPKLARNYDFAVGLKQAMYQHYDSIAQANRDQMDHLFGNADIFIAFAEDTTKTKAISMIPSIFESLLTCTREVEGDIDKSILPKGTKRITIARGEFVGPMFNAAGLALYIKNVMTERIAKKFSKGYECNCPLELLVHSSIKSLQPEILWLDDVRELVPSCLKETPFRRVWIFDYVESNIIYVYPDV